MNKELEGQTRPESTPRSAGLRLSLVTTPRAAGARQKEAARANTVNESDLLRTDSCQVRRQMNIPSEMTEKSADVIWLGQNEKQSRRQRNERLNCGFGRCDSQGLAVR
jgi:hypothetical protein